MHLQKKEFGSTLKELRTERKLTQPQFAELLGISTSYLRNLESCRRSPSFETFRRIIRYLELSADTFIYTDREPNDSACAEMTNIFLDCNETQRRIILALAKSIRDMPNLAEQDIPPLPPDTSTDLSS